MSIHQVEQLHRLRREWIITAASYGLLTTLAYLTLRRVWSAAYALRWSLVATLLVVYILGRLWTHLADNHAATRDSLYVELGLANHLSLLRGVLLAFLGGFLFSPRPVGALAWAAGVLYTTAIVIDYGDGIVARLTNHPSVLGEKLDTELDALGILIAPALGVWWGQLPFWYLLVALAYYLFVLGKWLRTRRGKPVYALPPSAIRRPLAGIQMGFISAVLWPVLTPPFTWWAGTLVMIPFLAGFVRDWLVVSGRADATSDSYRKLTHSLGNVMQHWIPVGLRLAIGGALLFFFGPALQTSNFAPYSTMSPLTVSWILLLALLTISGAVGRLAATLLAIFLGLALVRLGSHPATLIVIGCCLALMLLGTGAWSIWQPEEIFLQRRYGGGIE